MSAPTRLALILGALYALMLLLALAGCVAIGRTHALDMSDGWCAAHPSAPAYHNCKRFP